MLIKKRSKIFTFFRKHASRLSVVLNKLLKFLIYSFYLKYDIFFLSSCGISFSNKYYMAFSEKMHFETNKHFKLIIRFAIMNLFINY